MEVVKSFTKRNTKYFGVFILWILMLWFTWFIENKAYAGNIDTGFMFFLLYPLVLALVVSIHKDEFDKDTQQPSEKQIRVGKTICNSIIIVFCLVFLSVILFIDPYIISVYQFLFTLIIFKALSRSFKVKEWIKLCNKKDIMLSVFVILVIFFIVMLLFLLIVNPITLNNAIKYLEETGYKNVEFVENIYSRFVLDRLYLDNDYTLSRLEDSMNFYLFKGEKNGEAYGIAVSVVGGRIVGESIVEGNEVLRYFLEN